MIFMNRWIFTNLNEMFIDEIHCFRPRERPKPAWKPWWPWWIQTFLGPNWNSGTVVLSTMCNMCITCRSPRRIMSRFVACSSRVEYFGVLWRRWQMESCKWCLWSSQMVCAGMVCFCANSLSVPRAAMAPSTCMEQVRPGIPMRMYTVESRKLRKHSEEVQDPYISENYPKMKGK